MTLTQSELSPSVYQRIRQGVDIHKILKSWPALLESQEMLGGCQAIELPLSCLVIEWEASLPKYGELSNN